MRAAPRRLNHRIQYDTASLSIEGEGEEEEEGDETEEKMRVISDGDLGVVVRRNHRLLASSLLATGVRQFRVRATRMRMRQSRLSRGDGRTNGRGALTDGRPLAK